MTERYSRHQPPSHRRKTPSFSSSLLDSILRSIDDEALHVHNHNHSYDHNIHEHRFCASEPKCDNKFYLQGTHLKKEEEQRPSLQRAIMINQWMETQSKNNPNGYAYPKSCSKLSSDSSSSGTETPSTHRSLPNSFTISRKAAEALFLDDSQKACSTKVERNFMKSTKIKAMKIYGDLKKVKQPISPGSRISAFIYSLFASSNTKKAKHEESMQNYRYSKQDTTTCTSFSRSCMSKKQPSSSVKRSVRFYPANDAVILDRKSIDKRDSKYERRWFTEKNYKNFMVNNEDYDEDEDEDDLFELEIVGGVGTRAYGQELPVFETTDLRKIRI